MYYKQAHGHRLTGTQANLRTQKSKNLKKPNNICCQCWSPRYRVSVFSTRCGGCHPKGLIVASSYKIKQTIIIITIIRISTNIFYRPVLILLLTKEEKKSLIYFIPTSYFHQKSIKCIKFDSLADFTINFKKLFSYKTSYLQAQFKGNFQQMVVFQN